MKIKNIALMTVAVLGVAFVSGCLSVPAGYVTSNIPVSQNGYTVVADKVSGVDQQINVLGFGVSRFGSAQDRAVQNALKQAPGADALVGMAIDFQSSNLVFVQILTTRVTGTAVKTKK